MEHIKNLDEIGPLLYLLNQWWTSSHGPPEITTARVASIFKKGNPNEQANYRPISLLNTFYKLLASIIQKRLAAAIDHHLQPTQYGFRSQRSGIQAIHTIRRHMDKAERTGKPLGIILLDWEKAFDKISHSSLLHTLKRYQLPPTLLNLITNIYDNPTFYVNLQKQQSETIRKTRASDKGARYHHTYS